MFKTSNIIKPIANIKAFLTADVDTMMVRNVENIAKAINVYIPEQGKSIVKDVDCPVDVVNNIVGAPYAVESVTGIPNGLSSAYEACVLKFASPPPNVYKTSLGIGTRNRRKIMGKISVFKVFMLKSISVMPAMNIGKESK
jgi:hypothetical protein